MIRRDLFEIVCIALGSQPKCSLTPTNDEWVEIMNMMLTHRLVGIFNDALPHLSEYQKPQYSLLMNNVGQTIMLERLYEQQKATIKKLSTHFSAYGLKMVLMKGYGLSKNYPIPKHRGIGDLDIYFCGQGEYADELIKGLGIEVKQNEEKHSVYDYHGVHVENHASIICEQEHPSLLKVEAYLKDELNTNIYLDEETGCWLPSAMFNAVFLPIHFAGHFVYGGANLRQIIDYALVVRNAKENSDFNLIDWDIVKKLAIDGGYFKFLCCLNSICIKYIGISAECFPDWSGDKAMEERILNEILDPMAIDTHSLIGKMKRYLCNRWKYRLVYSKESHLIGFLLRTRSWLNWKWGRKNVWSSK